MSEKNSNVPAAISVNRRGAIPIVSEAAKEVLQKKQASMQRNAPGASYGHSNRMAAVQVVRSAPKVYSPLTENSNLQMPRDLRTMNAWNRHFYNVNPLVRNAINLHATYPISKFQLQCEDPKVKQFFEDQFEHINMQNLLHAVALEYWKIGEVLPQMELDPSEGIWDRGFIHNSDYIRIQVSPLADEPIITLIPDEQLKRVVSSVSPLDAQLRAQLPPEILTLIKKGLDIPLNSFNVSHLKHLSSDYDIRGTSLITCVYKDLMLYDKLREAEFVQADDMVNPITHVKLGDPNGTWRPDDSDVADMRRAIEEAMYDPDFKLISHGAVSIERIGAGGAVLDTSRMWDMINKNVLLGLMVPEEILSGQGASYASATVSLEVLRSRYDRFRNTIEHWIRKKVLEPIAKIQDFYKWEHGRRRLIVPKIIWNKMNLRDVESYITTLIGLVGEKPGEGKISASTVLTMLDVDSDAMETEMRKERIAVVMRTKEMANLNKYSVEELASLDPTKPVPDLHPEAQPPAGEEGAIPGDTDAMGDLGGMGGMGGGGGMPDLGSLLGGEGGGEGGEPSAPGGAPEAPAPAVGGPG